MVSPKSADHANLGERVGKGAAQIERSGVERFDTFGGYLAGSGAPSLHDYFDYQALVFSRSLPSFV